MAQRWRPCKRRLFIRKLKRLGFGDPQHGTRHDFMPCQLPHPEGMGLVTRSPGFIGFRASVPV